MYQIDRESDVPLYAQIREAIEKAIGDGQLKTGDRLPSVACLAKDIGVTQATVRRALQDLAEAGITDSHVGRGTFIRESDVQAETESKVSAAIGEYPTQGVSASSAKMAATRRMRAGVNKALCEIMPLAHKEGLIQMTHGVPDPALIPADLLENACANVMQQEPQNLIQATEPQGLYGLRAEIARRASLEGVAVSPDQVLITNGVSQAVTLIGELVLNDEREVICETPGFLGMVNTLAALGHWVETVQRDEDGPIIAQLNRFSPDTQKLLYLCPWCHNPTGLNLSEERADELAAWARKNNALVVADEIFKDLLFEKNETESLFSKLGPEQVLVVSSLSKTVMTGLRIGWIIGSKERIRELTRLKKLMDSASPTLTQAVALEILQNGMYEEVNQQMKDAYRQRMSLMQKWLAKRMPEGIRWTKPEGGFSMTLELPHGYSSVALLLLAVEKGVSFLPGPLFDLDHRYVNLVRISCAWSDEQKIKEGIELLADAIAEFLNRPPADAGLSGLGGYQ